MTARDLALQYRQRPHAVWLPAALLVALIPLIWLAIVYPSIALALAAVPLAVLLVSEFSRAIMFVIAFETFFPLFENRSAALASLPIGIALLALLMLSAAAARFAHSGRHVAQRWTAVDYAIGAFIALSLLDALAGSNYGIAMGGVRDELKFFLVYLAVRWAGPSLSAAATDRIVKVVVALLFIIAVVGALQYFVAYSLLANFAKVDYTFALQYMGLGQYSPDGGLHVVVQPRRSYSLLMSPLFTGYASMGGALFALALFLARAVRRRIAVFWFAICTICTFLTYARTALAGIVAGTVVLLGMLLVSNRITRSAKARLMGSLLVGLLVAGAVVYAAKPSLLQYPLSVFSGDTAATNGHYQFLRDDVAYLVAHPLGAGIGSASHVFFGSTAQPLTVWTESWYFYVAAELGIPGLAAYLIVCGLVLRAVLRAARLDGERGAADWRTLGTALWFVGLLVAQIAGVPFFSWMLSAAVWALVALVVNKSTISGLPARPTIQAYGGPTDRRSGALASNA